MTVRQRFISAVLIAASLSVLLLSAAKSACAEDELGEGMAGAARDIAAVMKAVRMESITVKDFEDKTTLGSPILAGLERQLKEELTKLKVTIKPSGGAVGVKGIVRVATENDNSHLRIEFQLLDEDGNELKTLNKQVARPADHVRPDTGTVPSPSPPGVTPEPGPVDNIDVEKGKIGVDFAGETAAFIAWGANVDRNAPPLGTDIDAIKEAIKHPTARIVGGTSAKASAESPFEVQIISQNGSPKQLRLVDNQPFVDFQQGEKFTIRVTNKATFKIAAILTLDGINSFHDSQVRKDDGTPKYHAWVFPSGSNVIKGWHIDNSRAQEFVATTFDKSKLKEHGLEKSPIGAVTVVFRTAWDSKGKPPADEYLRREIVTLPDGTRRIETQHLVGAAPPPDVFIGGGDVIGVKTEEAKVEFGRVRGSISIRYRHPLAGETGK